MRDRDTRMINKAFAIDGRLAQHRLLRFKKVLEDFAGRDVDMEYAKEVLRKIRTPSDDRAPHAGSFVQARDQRLYAKEE